MDNEEQMPTLFPCAARPLIRDKRKSQLEVALYPDHEHPEVGLVQTSIHTEPQRFPEIPLTKLLTWAAGSFPLQGNMQISVVSPADLALLRLLTAFASKIPDDLNALMIAKVFPLFLRQVKVEAGQGLAISTPLTAKTASNRLEMMVQAKMSFILRQIQYQRFIQSSKISYENQIFYLSRLFQFRTYYA